MPLVGNESGASSSIFDDVCDDKILMMTHSCFISGRVRQRVRRFDPGPDDPREAEHVQSRANGRGEDMWDWSEWPQPLASILYDERRHVVVVLFSVQTSELFKESTHRGTQTSVLMAIVATYGSDDASELDPFTVLPLGSPNVGRSVEVVQLRNVVVAIVEFGRRS